ncbi:MAG: DUF6794 domain-containing protein [Candidatus Kapabacteria bacterium]|jgi:hypothetical protein|nr:DUF6794 domain-containing protein [Candidatus Kapabacteria bacterium]
MKRFILLYAATFCLMNISNLLSMDSDSLNILIEKDFYKQILQIIPEENLKDIQNVSFDEFNRSGYFVLNLERIYKVPIDKKIDKLYKKLENSDTCIKYFDIILCKQDKWIIYELKNMIDYGFYHYLQNQQYDLRKHQDSLITIVQTVDSMRLYNSIADSIDGIYIPKDLEDALSDLDKHLSKEWKSDFIKKSEDTAVGISHHGKGLGIRNSYRLWGRSRLQRSIQKQYGFDNPDRQSSFILTLYYRKLKGLELKIDEEAALRRKQEAEQNIQEELREIEE